MGAGTWERRYGERRHGLKRPAFDPGARMIVLESVMRRRGRIVQGSKTKMSRSATVKQRQFRAERLAITPTLV